MVQLFKNAGDRTESWGAVAASSRGTVITGNASANTKGAYAQLIASTAYDINYVLLIVHMNSVGSTVSALLDIAIGAAASEQIVIPDILMSFNMWVGRGGFNIVVPCKIPAGSRVAARVQSANGATSFDVILYGINSGANQVPGGKLVAYGTALATSRGTSVDPGATINTKGAYSQLVASTNEDLRSIIVLIGSQDLDKTGTCSALLDIAIGAAASEQIIFADLALGVDVNQQQYMPLSLPMLPCKIPAGSRIAARAQNSINTAAHRAFDVAILGVSL